MGIPHYPYSLYVFMYLCIYEFSIELQYFMVVQISLKLVASSKTTFQTKIQFFHDSTVHGNTLNKYFIVKY